MSSRKRPPVKAAHGRSKKHSRMPSESAAITPENATRPSQGFNMEAFTASITTAVSNAVTAAMEARDQPSAEPRTNTSTAAVAIEEAISDQLGTITASTSGTKELESSGASIVINHSEQ